MSSSPTTLIFGTFQFNTQNGFAAINTLSTPTSTLTLGGSFSPGAMTTTVSYDLGNYDHTIFCNASSAITLLLPSPGTCYYREIVVKDVSGVAATYNITIQSAAGNIDTSATYILNSNFGKVKFQNDGSNWWII
jgi:hypothetical protein